MSKPFLSINIQSNHSGKYSVTVSYHDNSASTTGHINTNADGVIIAVSKAIGASDIPTNITEFFGSGVVNKEPSQGASS